eukprot:Protomagalhaensia_sp_Gyna_25__2666@NODE_2521_length_1037_cov_3_076152_g2089_i0_p2_GENE_NODE_2521_length_1037_cov_3_076152_g2089_i0NODE_2521_length_1037_cov_3_076152_g2089_i0_p2_ORF_typecomplete_len190_score2_00Orthopox_A47/PF06334_11/0_019_NODE_2521_length_1037_cov_3_076152_g2089_i043570
MPAEPRTESSSSSSRVSVNTEDIRTLLGRPRQGRASDISETSLRLAIDAVDLESLSCEIRPKPTVALSTLHAALFATDSIFLRELKRDITSEAERLSVMMNIGFILGNPFMTKPVLERLTTCEPKEVRSFLADQVRLRALQYNQRPIRQRGRGGWFGRRGGGQMGDRATYNDRRT